MTRALGCGQIAAEDWVTWIAALIGKASTRPARQCRSVVVGCVSGAGTARYEVPAVLCTGWQTKNLSHSSSVTDVRQKQVLCVLWWCLYQLDPVYMV
jgi:hypothetical protein